MRDCEYASFIRVLKRHYGFDLGKYKSEHVEPKVWEASRFWKYENLEEFGLAIVKEKQHFYEFVEYITVNLTAFFRNQSEWEYLSDAILPRLFRENDCPVFWSAGCSTGEEAFSLAVLLRNLDPACKTTILATDIVEPLVAAAQTGTYGMSSLEEIPEKHRTLFPLGRGADVEVHPDVKRKVSFFQHDMLTDMFEKNLDMILCRNVLTQFNSQAKEEMYANFSQSLKPGGLLFIGMQEQIFQPEKYGLNEIRPHFYIRSR